MTAPTIQQIIDAVGGKASRDGESVVVSYGANGFLRVHPEIAILRGEEIPAARVEGKLARRNGAHHADLREALNDANIYA